MDADPHPLSPAPAPPLDAPPPSSALRLPPRIPRQSAFVAATLGWVLPGLGQLYVGRPRKGLLMGVTICGLFALGLWMTGFTCVDPESYGLEFVAHLWIGGPTAATYWLSRDILLTDPLPYFEVGRLYAAVAGLLNVVAICDALGGVIDRNETAAERDRLRDTMVWDHERALHEAERAAALASATGEPGDDQPGDDQPGQGKPTDEPSPHNPLTDGQDPAEERA